VALVPNCVAMPQSAKRTSKRKADLCHRTGAGALCNELNKACVGGKSFEEAGLGLGAGSRWEIGPWTVFVHTCASVVGVSVDPSVVGRGCSPVSSNKARGYCCRTPGGH
jgi:hypothetical protein